MDNIVPRHKLTEKKEFSSLEEFKTLKELPDSKPFALVSSDAILIFFNRVFENIFALKKGESLDKLNSDPKLPIILENMLTNMYGNFQFEILLLDDSNTPLYQFLVDINRIFITGSDYFVLSFNPQTEKKLIEKKINNLSHALEFGDVPVLIASENGIVNYVSKSFEKILNKGIDKLFGYNLGDIFNEMLTTSDYMEMVASIKKKQMWIKTISDIGETGELWYKELKINPVKLTESVETTFIVTANDITNYVAKNRVIQKSEQKQRLIINNISDPLLIIKKNEDQLLFESANENMCTLLGLSKINVGHKPISIILPFALNAKINKAILEVESSGLENIEFRYSSEINLREFICKLSHAEDLYDRGKLFIVSFNDITEQIRTEKMLRKAYEQETRLNKLKSAFLANMSHEIRTPLNAIVGYSDLLEDDINDKNYESLPDILSYLKDGVDRLLSLVGNIVEVSMLESGDYTIDLNPYRVNNFLIDLEQQYQEETIQKQISVEVNLDQENPYIHVDEVKFKKVLETIMDNAIKYNRANGKIIISSSSENNRVVVRITDTGIGIEEGKIQNILEPFMQVEEEGFTRNYEGAGLGLTIAYRLTQLFKGRLEIKSQINIGTTIKISLPAVESRMPEIQ